MGGFEQFLAHQFGGVGVLRYARHRPAIGADQLEDAGDQLGRTFHFLEAGRLEEVAVEERAQDVAHLPFRLPYRRLRGFRSLPDPGAALHPRPGPAARQPRRSCRDGGR